MSELTRKIASAISTHTQRNRLAVLENATHRVTTMHVDEVTTLIVEFANGHVNPGAPGDPLPAARLRIGCYNQYQSTASIFCCSETANRELNFLPGEGKMTSMSFGNLKFAAER